MCVKRGWVQVPTVHGTGALYIASLRSADAQERLVMGLTYSSQYWHGFIVRIACTFVELGKSCNLWA